MTDNRELGYRAAQRHLDASLPPHGRHAGDHDPRTTVRSTEPGNIVIPARAVPSTERVSNVYEAKLAQNTQRRGTVQAAEGLAQRDGGGVEQMFAGGFSDARTTGAPQFEKKIANGRSGLADGHDGGNPAWVDDRAALFGFASTSGDAGQRGAAVPSLSARSTPQTFTDLSRLDLTERSRTSFGKTFGSDTKLPRHNEAEIND
jgi:hypothetical protein